MPECARREAEPPCDQVPGDCAQQSRQDHPGCDQVDIDEPFTDRFRHRRPEQKRGYEIEERRPQHRLKRCEHFGGDDGRDGVSGVVKSVDVVKNECDPDNEDSQCQRGHR
jgi:hypothetical protein